MAGPTNVALGEAELSSERERKSVRKLYGSGSLTTVVILVMQQPNKTNPIDATPTDKPYFTPHTISTHQNVKIRNQCIS